MGSKRSLDICHGQPTVMKKFMGSPSFLMASGVPRDFPFSGERPREIIMGCMRENKVALGRRVPKCWALLDFSGIRPSATSVSGVFGLQLLVYSAFSY